MLEWHRHSPRRHHGLQILRGRQRRDRSAWRIPDSSNFRGRIGRNLSDREASYIGAEYLRERLEQEDEHALYDVSTADVIRIIQKIGIR